MVSRKSEEGKSPKSGSSAGDGGLLDRQRQQRGGGGRERSQVTGNDMTFVTLGETRQSASEVGGEQRFRGGISKVAWACVHDWTVGRNRW